MSWRALGLIALCVGVWCGELRAAEPEPTAVATPVPALASSAPTSNFQVAPSGGGLTWPGAIPICALTGEGLDALREAIREALRGAGPLEDPIVTKVRHAAALEETVAALDRARDALPLGEEIVLEELRAALTALGEIGGEVGNDELYDRIFSTFCIGK